VLPSMLAAVGGGGGGDGGGGGFIDTQNHNPHSFRSRPRVGIKFIDPMNYTHTEDP